MQDRSLLFVHIDGVISSRGLNSSARPAGAFRDVDRVIHVLSSGAAVHLLALGERFALVWRRGRAERGEKHLPHALGLPGGRSFLTFARNPGRANGHRKLSAIEGPAGPRRPPACIGDAAGEGSRAAAGARGAPALLVATTPEAGPRRVRADEPTARAVALACAA